MKLNVGYFDQGLGALHSKCLSKYAFWTFFTNEWKRKKSNKIDIKFRKNIFLKWHQTAVGKFFSGNNTCQQGSGANSKKHSLLNFASILLLFLPFLQLFCAKNIEKAYVDQCFECAAPKRLSKYKKLNQSY